MDRTTVYERFCERFRRGKRPRPATAAQLDEPEGKLGVVWPESFRRFAETCGPVYCPDLLDLVAAQRPGFSAVQQFLTPKQAATETRRWRLAEAGGGTAFAADASGNWFVFRGLPVRLPRPDDAPVGLFDLEAGDVAEEVGSFDEWLGRFLALA
jgi:hypothetical protein